MMSAVNFDDLDDLDAPAAPVASTRPQTIEQASQGKSLLKVPGKVVETCPRCRGTGRYHHVSEHGTICLLCKGAGKREFATTAEERAKKRQQSAARKQSKEADQLKAFEAQHPEFATWWADTGFAFALSLRDQAGRTGRLSEAQLAAGRKCIAKQQAAQVERQARVARAEERQVLDLSAITDAMAKAQDSGIKFPKMRLLAGDAGFILSMAGASSKWAGSLYLKSTEHGGYLGRITKGRFYADREVAADLEQAIVTACQDPKQSAVAYGRRTGSCSCCGRELTNHASIEAGIGPICESRFF